MRALSICILGMIMVWLIPNQANAQQYVMTPSMGVFTPLVGGTAIDMIETDDQITNAINIGFTFNYFGQDYTQVKISSNGFITFDLNWGSDLNNAIGAGATASKLIAPLWDDLGGMDGQASYSVTGNVGSRVFTVEWLNWRWPFISNSAISFQASLSETTNEIRFTYRQEAGVLDSPSASIGIVGTSPNQFFSITPPLANPQFSISGDNSIDQKPANGQNYSFLPSLVVVNAPTIAASDIGSSLGASSGMLTWTNGDGARRAVFMKETSALEAFTPVNDQAYVANSSFGSGVSAGNGWYCVYNGTGSSVNVSGLKSGFSYRVHVVEYNGLGGDEKYFAQSASMNPRTSVTSLVRPSTPTSTVSLNYLSHDRVQFNLGEGQGNFRAIFVRASSSGLAPAVDNVTYSADAVFGNGNQIGSSGWFCVFNGISATNLLVTGLSPGTSYKIHIVDYNGSDGNQLYNATSESATATFTTYPNHAVAYNFASSAGNFSPVVGGTSIPSIQSDDNFSSGKVPIGFTFYFKGIPYSELTPSSNGFLSFNAYVGALASSFPGNSLANALARPLIAPLWDDIDGAGGQASYLTTGIAPNRIFTIQYLNWQWDYNATNNISFQVKLYEADNKIEFIYRQEAGALNNAHASIGLAFANPNDFASLSNASANPTMSLVSETSAIATKPATGQVFSFTPNKINQAITFDALAQKSFGNSAFLLTASSTSGLPITYTSSDPTVASVSGNTVTFVKVGQTTITATQSGNSLFNAATQVQRLLTITKGNQSISFADLNSKKYGDTLFSLNATATSGLTIEYESSNPAVATIAGNQVTIVGVGTSTITARQPGNENFNAAAEVQKTLTVQKGDQQITFASLPEKIVGDNPFQITASSTVGLPVSFVSSNNSIATVSGNTVTIVGHGIVSITASQSGNANYNAAAPVEKTLKVRSNQSITFAEIPTKKLGDPNFTLSPTASSGLAVQLSTTSDKVTLINGIVSLVSPGTVTIIANQPGNEIFFAAQSVERTFCINPPKPAVQVSGLGSEAPVLQSSSPAHNQWFKDGVAITGQTNNSLTISGAGLYTVKVVVEGCSSEASDAESLVVTGVALEQDEIRIFPNPSRERITIDVSAMNLKQEVPVDIVDFNGRKVLQSSVRKSVDLDITKLAVGNYLILIKDGSRAVSKEFVKH